METPTLKKEKYRDSREVNSCVELHTNMTTVTFQTATVTHNTTVSILSSPHVTVVIFMWMGFQK